MKKLSVLSVLFFIATICSAQIALEVNEDGSFRASGSKWSSSGTTADTSALEYASMFSQAISSPGEKIVVKEKEEKLIKLTAMFEKLVELEEISIVYSEEDGHIYYFAEEKEMKKSSYILLVVILLLILAIATNLLYKKNRKAQSGIFSFVLIFSIIYFALTMLLLDSMKGDGVFIFIFSFSTLSIIPCLYGEENMDTVFQRVLFIAYISILGSMIMLFV